jgi:hypothetical protein
MGAIQGSGVIAEQAGATKRAEQENTRDHRPWAEGVPFGEGDIRKASPAIGNGPAIPTMLRKNQQSELNPGNVPLEGERPSKIAPSAAFRGATAAAKKFETDPPQPLEACRYFE